MKLTYLAPRLIPYCLLVACAPSSAETKETAISSEEAVTTLGQEKTIDFCNGGLPPGNSVCHIEHVNIGYGVTPRRDEPCDFDPQTHVPTGWPAFEWVPSPSAANAPMTWGGGNELYHGTVACILQSGEVWQNRVDTGGHAGDTMLRITSYQGNARPANVRATVHYQWSVGTWDDKITLALQVWNPDGSWRDVASDSRPGGQSDNWQDISYPIGFNIPVRLELRVAAASKEVAIYLEDARLFGPRCTLDAANPSSCL